MYPVHARDGLQVDFKLLKEDTVRQKSLTSGQKSQAEVSSFGKL